MHTNKLPPEERKSCAIFGQNYGQAGAIDFFGAKLGLPNAISGHQNYYYWGPGAYTGECMIVMGDNQERLQELFGDVKFAGRVEHPLSMPYQHFDVFVCRNQNSAPLRKFGRRSNTGIKAGATCLVIGQMRMLS